MISLKTPEEIELLAEGGVILGNILDILSHEMVPGMTGKQLDDRAQEMIKEKGVKAAFLNYAPGGSSPFPAALCVSSNQAIVHGLPSDEPFEEGDIVGIDLGIVYKGLYLDSARTVAVGKISKEAHDLMTVTRRSLELGIEQAMVGKTTGDIGQAVQKYVEDKGYEVVRQLVGHGVGHAVHEDPKVPNYGKKGSGVKLEEGLVIAIEPMVTIGSADITTASDGWTIETVGGGLASHEEHTVAVTSEGPRVLT